MRPLRLAYALARIALPGGGWIHRGRGECPSCGERTLYVLAARHAAWIRRLTRDWEHGDAFKRGLEERESNLCASCRANLRMRLLARTVLDILGCDSPAALGERMRREPGLRLYETAHRSVFRSAAVCARPGYVSSEYREDAPSGVEVDGVRNENVEALSFADASFDIVITSEVLEHVPHLDRALDEIRRVLKPGGHHVCTVPADPCLARTRERATLTDAGVEHRLPPVMHGDSLRGGGILAFRDFGADAASVLARRGGETREIATTDEDGFVSSVFVTLKTAG